MQISEFQQKNKIKSGVNLKAMSGLGRADGSRLSSFVLPNRNSSGDGGRASSGVRRVKSSDECVLPMMKTMRSSSGANSNMANASWGTCDEPKRGVLSTAAPVQSCSDVSKMKECSGRMSHSMMLSRDSGSRTVAGDAQKELMVFVSTLHPSAATLLTRKSMALKPPSRSNVKAATSSKGDLSVATSNRSCQHFSSIDTFADDDDDDDDEDFSDLLNYAQDLKGDLKTSRVEPRPLSSNQHRFPSIAKHKNKAASVFGKGKGLLGDVLANISAHDEKGKGGTGDMLSSGSSHSIASRISGLSFYKNRKLGDALNKPKPLIDMNSDLDLDYDEPDFFPGAQKTASGNSILRPPSLTWVDSPTGSRNGHAIVRSSGLKPPSLYNLPVFSEETSTEDNVTSDGAKIRASPTEEEGEQEEVVRQPRAQRRLSLGRTQTRRRSSISNRDSDNATSSEEDIHGYEECGSDKPSAQQEKSEDCLISPDATKIRPILTEEEGEHQGSRHPRAQRRASLGRTQTRRRSSISNRGCGRTASSEGGCLLNNEHGLNMKKRTTQEEKAGDNQVRRQARSQRQSSLGRAHTRSRSIEERASSGATGNDRGAQYPKPTSFDCEEKGSDELDCNKNEASPSIKPKVSRRRSSVERRRLSPKPTAEKKDATDIEAFPVGDTNKAMALDSDDDKSRKVPERRRSVKRSPENTPTERKIVERRRSSEGRECRHSPKPSSKESRVTRSSLLSKEEAFKDHDMKDSINKDPKRQEDNDAGGQENTSMLHTIEKQGSIRSSERRSRRRSSTRQRETTSQPAGDEVEKSTEVEAVKPKRSTHSSKRHSLSPKVSKSSRKSPPVIKKNSSHNKKVNGGSEKTIAGTNGQKMCSDSDSALSSDGNSDTDVEKRFAEPHTPLTTPMISTGMLNEMSKFKMVC